MKATINGIQVEGTPEEIAEFDRLVSIQVAGPAPMQPSEARCFPSRAAHWHEMRIGGNTLYCGDGQLAPQQHQNSIHQTMASYLQAYAAERDGGE